MTRPPSQLFYQGRGRKPLLDRADGVYMWDVSGKRYLDGSSGAMVCNIGHSDARVLEAMRAQMAQATFGYRLQFETEASEALATRLAALCPDGVNRVFFTSGGSEAVESALKLARQYALASGQAGRWKVLTRAPSYHGCTLGALATTSYDPLTEPFAPMMQAMPKVPAPRAYLDGLDPGDPATGAHYAAMVDAAIMAEGPETMLAFLLEPVGGASTGALVPPAGYMEAVQEICRRHGVLLILDEVMTGVGRTGAFLAGEHWGMQPDIVVMSKGLGAGYVPLGAMIAHERLVEPVLDAGGFAHGFTYAGNPLACAAGLAVLDVVAADRLGQNSAALEAPLRACLTRLAEAFPIIGDVRGKGLLQAFELMADRRHKTPLPPALNAHARIVELAYEAGLIVYSRRSRGGHEGDHIIVAPPLIATEAHLDEIEAGLHAALSRFTAEIEAAP